MENIFSVISKITLIFTWNPFSMTIFNFQYKKTALLLLFTALNLGLIWGQTSDFLGFNFETFASKHPEEKICLSATNSTSNKRALASIGIQVKYESPNFLFFNASHKELSALKENQSIQGLYFSFSRPKSLGDSSLLKHKVNWVHQGLNGIDTNYTGKGIIVGIVDQGIDFNHPDFKTNTGKTRVLRYWDHTVNGPNPPQPYNYGTVWDSSSINNGTCTSLETVTAHGTTVAGMAAGNARANLKNKGAAPEADIIVVETNFNLANWTLTIADACDYIFKVADSLNKPAVINLSLGDYLGSHDGNDPAADYIESLLDMQNGRIVVCAAGNAGNQGKFHVKNAAITSDTSFFWNIPNTGATVAGPNKIVFDLWSDTADAHYHFAYGADKITPNFSYRGHSTFRYATANMAAVPLYDTIYNAVGQRIACIETYREIVGANYHLLSVFQTIDSMAYRYRFMTTGSGKYDAWGGSWIQLSNFSTSIPTALQYPAIQDYVMPDSLQTIVSSWNCSEKVVSVANMRNRKGYIDKNNNYYTPASTTPVGKLSENSSKGPNRHGLTKPDITAAGDVTLSAGPIWYLSNTANNSTIDQGGFHVRNGGTSMASPVVTGIAALYLQKCRTSNYQSFKNDLTSHAVTDAATGVTPNNGYGFGKADAYALILSKNINVYIDSVAGICTGGTAALTAHTSATVYDALWSNGVSGLNLTTAIVGPYSIKIEDSVGCYTHSPVITLGLLPLPYVDGGASFFTCPGVPVTLTGTGTAIQYTWSGGVVNQQAFLPTQNQTFYVTGTGPNGCQASDSTTITLFNVNPVQYNETTVNVFTGSNPFNVSPGTPSGGVYSGSGIIGTSFHPTLTGPGFFTIQYAITDSNGCISSDSSVIHVVSGAGIEMYNTATILITPNPANDVIEVQGLNEAIQVKVMDAQGKLVATMALTPENGTINVRRFTSGVYFLETPYGRYKWIKN